MLRKFLRDESGATAIEYSMIAGFIALAIIAAVGQTGQRLVALFQSLITATARPMGHPWTSCSSSLNAAG